jgi:glycosyltransferase involved in cell wall biosynthesis
MKISIITPVFNGAKTIQDTLASVRSQTYGNVEHIVVDGGSTDGTGEIVSKNISEYNSPSPSYLKRGGVAYKFVSEPDKGIYDAMNKGIRMATGEVIGILNADDMYVSGDVLEKVMKRFEETGAGAVYGDLEYVKRDDVTKVVRRWRAGDLNENHNSPSPSYLKRGENQNHRLLRKVRGGWAVPHPALFVKKSLYDAIGLYREDFRIAGDYEFMIRLFLGSDLYNTKGNGSRIASGMTKGKIEYIPEVLVRMREGGVSGASLRQRKKGWAELKRAWKVNGFPVPPLFIFRRVLAKVGQYFRR